MTLTKTWLRTCVFAGIPPFRLEGGSGFQLTPLSFFQDKLQNEDPVKCTFSLHNFSPPPFFFSTKIRSRSQRRCAGRLQCRMSESRPLHFPLTLLHITWNHRVSLRLWRCWSGWCSLLKIPAGKTFRWHRRESSQHPGNWTTLPPAAGSSLTTAASFYFKIILSLDLRLS